jgi:hypothetical protein
VHPLVGSVWTLAEDFHTQLPFLIESHHNTQPRTCRGLHPASSASPPLRSGCRD